MSRRSAAVHTAASAGEQTARAMSEADDPSDDELFQAAMSGVRPLRHDRVPLAVAAPAPIPRQALADDQAVLRQLLDDPEDPDTLACGEELAYLKPGLQRRILRKLRRGHYSLAAELDLHGLTVALAREALAEFLLRARQQDHRCVRIIHGKGRRSSNKGPVLKVKVDRWLRQRAEVLAFCSARPVDGGSGALYVLLKHDA